MKNSKKFHQEKMHAVAKALFIISTKILGFAPPFANNFAKMMGFFFLFDLTMNFFVLIY